MFLNPLTTVLKALTQNTIQLLTNLKNSFKKKPHTLQIQKTKNSEEHPQFTTCVLPVVPTTERLY